MKVVLERSVRSLYSRLRPSVYVECDLWSRAPFCVSLAERYTGHYTAHARRMPSFSASFLRSGLLMYFCIWKRSSKPLRWKSLNTARRSIPRRGLPRTPTPIAAHGNVLGKGTPAIAPTLPYTVVEGERGGGGGEGRLKGEERKV
ncbi:hypothetical protein E2C01_066821 [Portunus trituberculatus]|uniref:Uncharacterized protein n=1 Tax=Portunus trituberculatus TaxID=210409 RepID=A0A5B7HJ70_PORTR|nr:hypothetical protein [Portunus trituberculatus]